MTSRRALIAGGGLGGLTAAVALHHAGWEVCVLEQAPALEAVGAGVSLWPNALRALDLIGVGAQVRARGTLSGPSGVRTPDGSWLNRSNLSSAVRARFGEPLLLVHRAELADLLVRQLPFGAVQTSTRVLGVHVGADSVPATLITQHAETDADLVVAADGIRSTLRGFLYPQYPAPVHAGYAAWRMVLRERGRFADQVGDGFETWGTAGRRFTVLPLGRDQLYCHATAGAGPSSDRRPTGHGDEQADLRRLFGDWHQPIPQIIAALTPGQLLHTDVEELATPLPTFDRGRVVLLGDAAHAMTPDLGQGGGMAIEDAAVLAAVLGDARPVVAALHEYTRQRLPRTTAVARRSRSAGRMNSAPYGAQVLAARLMGKLPGGTVPRGINSIVGWLPPAPDQESSQS